MSARKRPSPHVPERDVHKTAFTEILSELVARVPGAYAAALVDGEGETVDYAGDVDPFDVRIAAAHLQILLSQMAEDPVFGGTRWIIVRGANKSIVGQRLPEGYAITMLLRRRAGFGPSQRALSSCERALAREAGWPRSDGPAWFAVEVEVDHHGRPRRVGNAISVDVLGAIVGLPARQKGFRVRTASGLELTLVREQKRFWYADEDLAHVSSGAPPPRS